MKLKAYILSFFKKDKSVLCCPKCGSKRCLRKKTYMNVFFKIYCLNCKKTSEYRIVKKYNKVN